jgi:hypothetical protein
MYRHNINYIPDYLMSPPDPKPYVCPVCDTEDGHCTLEHSYAIGEDCSQDLANIVLCGDVKRLARYLQTVPYDDIERPTYCPKDRDNPINRIADVLRELADHIDALKR